MDFFFLLLLLLLLNYKAWTSVPFGINITNVGSN